MPEQLVRREEEEEGRRQLASSRTSGQPLPLLLIALCCALQGREGEKRCW